jgi:hypothetical protein
LASTRVVAVLSLVILGAQAALLVLFQRQALDSVTYARAIGKEIEAFAIETRHAWAIDPTDPGPSLPPHGRSLFDILTAQAGAGRGIDIPFPFEALLAKLANRVGCADARPAPEATGRCSALSPRRSFSSTRAP